MSDRTQAQREFDLYAREDEQARAIIDRAAEENRTTSPEEDEQYERLFASAQKHKDRSDKLLKDDQSRAALEEAVRGRIGDTTAEGSGDPEPKPKFEAELIRLMIDTAERVKNGGDKKREVEIGPELIEESRAIADFSNSDALYVSEFANAVAVYQRTLSPWINIATVRTSDNGRPLIIPNLTADVTGYSPGEGTAITESTPTFGTATATLTSYKALAYVSFEADEDAMYDVMPYISRSQGRSLGLQFGSAATTAILAAATNGGTAGGLGGGSTATFIGYEDLLTLKYGRAAPYRATGSWIMSNGLILKARKWQDLNGDYLWQRAIAAGQPPTFDGDPVYEDPYLATPASANKSVLFGDASAVLVKQMPLRFAVSTEYRFNTDEIALKAVYRAAAALPDAAALAYMVSANS